MLCVPFFILLSNITLRSFLSSAKLIWNDMSAIYLKDPIYSGMLNKLESRLSIKNVQALEDQEHGTWRLILFRSMIKIPKSTPKNGNPVWRKTLHISTQQLPFPDHSMEFNEVSIICSINIPTVLQQCHLWRCVKCFKTSRIINSTTISVSIEGRC